MIIYPVSIIHHYLYNHPATVCVFIYLYLYIPSNVPTTHERYSDYPDETDDGDITNGKQSFSTTAAQPELSMCSL